MDKIFRKKNSLSIKSFICQTMKESQMGEQTMENIKDKKSFWKWCNLHLHYYILLISLLLAVTSMYPVLLFIFLMEIPPKLDFYNGNCNSIVRIETNRFFYSLNFDSVGSHRSYEVGLIPNKKKRIETYIKHLRITCEWGVTQYFTSLKPILKSLGLAF